MKAWIVAAALLLSACNLNPYLKFDAQELQNFVEVQAEANVARTYCRSDPPRALEIAVVSLPFKASIAESYSMARSSKEVQQAATILRGLSDELKAAYIKGPVSPAYCEIKYSLISNAAAKIAVTISKKE